MEMICRNCGLEIELDSVRGLDLGEYWHKFVNKYHCENAYVELGIPLTGSGLDPTYEATPFTIKDYIAQIRKL
jgi:hypothetical protein